MRAGVASRVGVLSDVADAIGADVYGGTCMYRYGGRGLVWAFGGGRDALLAAEAGRKVLGGVGGIAVSCRRLVVAGVGVWVVKLDFVD